MTSFVIYFCYTGIEQGETMRADRLIAELMLLQTHGKVSAARMAREMEVSQRTIYRDMLALNTAGIPIYAENGSHGGYQLVDGYRTQLTGFSSGELQALFAMNIPAILGELGMDAEGKAALRKLEASLSNRENQEKGIMAQRFLFAPASSLPRRSESPYRSTLEKLQKAIWADHLVEIKIQFWYRPGEVRMQVAPYALVLQDNRWYLVCYRSDSFRIHLLEEIVEVIPQEQKFIRNPEFNLPGFWQEWAAIQQAQTKNFQVKLLLRSNAKSAFFATQQENIQSIDPIAGDWIPLICAFHGLDEARKVLLGWGGAIRIVEPEVLRLTMVDYAEQILQANTEKNRTPFDVR
ncbi:MAG: WYL domain-containing protein [Anaerolineae bacterium]|jgi:predicted DNA-binding transcriptional regulator YafY|nr:WYL domain-containing protein [Anaerolineae bacterium]